MTQKAKLEKAKHVREEHRRACLMIATTVIVIGAIVGVGLEMHGIGLIVEVLGLYLVAAV